MSSRQEPQTAAASMYAPLPRNVQPRGFGQETAVADLSEFVASMLTGRLSAASVIQSKLADKVLVLDMKRQSAPTEARRRGPQTLNVLRVPKAGKRALARLRAKQRHSVPPEERKYSIFQALEPLWNEYAASQVRASVGSSPMKSQVTRHLLEQLGDRVCRMDMHGAVIRVTKSKNAALVGIEGIVALETARTWAVVSKENIWRVVPKVSVVIQVRIPIPADMVVGSTDGSVGASSHADRLEQRDPAGTDNPAPGDSAHVVVSVNGGAFIMRSIERSAKKWKRRPAGIMCP
ncbi:Ribonuclease P protein subunit p29 [Porphyridium purpureum]|uniref:Ribonuclease P protein subunit p29 n=1 Tax=Porphyridium purpureum TaxID=35688 RepID=A0A5J4Z1Q6_PORPP|nr:Ribonuclease P protein subunit p29 [Porphyridium purpureum]|eukprot:POR7420..scf208_2